EPYVCPADVYASTLQTGQSGWTWYTGSAGWMYRIWVEEALGFRRTGNSFTVRPAIPPDWKSFNLSYRYGKTTYRISVVRSEDSPGIELDGLILAGGNVTLVDDGSEHTVTVRLA